MTMQLISVTSLVEITSRKSDHAGSIPTYTNSYSRHNDTTL